MTPLALATLAIVGLLSGVVDAIVGARSVMAANLMSAPRGLLPQAWRLAFGG